MTHASTHRRPIAAVLPDSPGRWAGWRGTLGGLVQMRVDVRGRSVLWSCDDALTLRAALRVAEVAGMETRLVASLLAALGGVRLDADDLRWLRSRLEAFAARAGEWDDLDEDRRQWRVPVSRGGASGARLGWYELGGA